VPLRLERISLIALKGHSFSCAVKAGTYLIDCFGRGTALAVPLRLERISLIALKGHSFSCAVKADIDWALAPEVMGAVR
jgi:hypothetical protein